MIPAPTGPRCDNEAATTPDRRRRGLRIDFLQYADLERHLFEDVRCRFHREHSIGCFDLFSIVIWKANRAKSYVARRLLHRAPNLERAARTLSRDLWREPSAEARLSALMTTWGLRLPIASAILTVFWPDEFTVYDERVRGQIGDFPKITRRNGHAVWQAYCAYRQAVERAAPADLTLRNKDRYLWGRSTALQLERDLRSSFGVSRK